MSDDKYSAFVGGILYIALAIPFMLLTVLYTVFIVAIVLVTLLSPVILLGLLLWWIF